MSKDFWKNLASQGPIPVLAPMDGYTDSPYRQIVKKIAPETICFSEFYSADGLVHSKQLQQSAFKHDSSEKPLIIQIFGKDPEMFRQAAILIEQAGAAGVDVNMGCPAKKVVKSGHGSSLMINTDTAFRIIEEMSKSVSIPISVKTRLGWNNWEEHLIPFAQGLQNAGANLLSVHGRTYQQAFNGKADWTGIYELKKHLSIPVIGNGDVLDYDDGIKKLGNLDGFMIGRASFGNPWCFLPGGYIPTLSEILTIMYEHGRLLVENKGRKGILESRKHLVQYLHGFAGVKEYRKSLVSVENLEDINIILERIRNEHSNLLNTKLNRGKESMIEVWEGEDCGL
ncbi:MAG: tRNA-dihydrouridine synthase family protein [Candidatus Gracilibacteria bacterium]|nr:tRNA-dihydrouridine synthase family protein [Candidatus Gracilibacteria bacterium]